MKFGYNLIIMKLKSVCLYEWDLVGYKTSGEYINERYFDLID